jgi:hypothetical protein
MAGYIGTKSVSLSTDAATISGDLTIGGDLSLGDNDKIILGAGSDLQIYSDGTTSRIYESGSGLLTIRASNFNVNTADGSESYITMVDGGAVTSYHNGAAKIATTSTGIDVTGTVTADGLTVDGDTVTANAQNAVTVEFNNATGIISADRTGGNYAGLSLRTTEGSAPVERLGIAYNGNVTISENLGIGTSAPDQRLHITDGTSSGAVLRLERSDTSMGNNDVYGGIEFEGNDTDTNANGIRGFIRGLGQGTGGGMKLEFGTAGGGAAIGAARMTLDADGNVSIGGSLTVDPASVGGKFLALDTSASGDGHILLQRAGSNKWQITSGTTNALQFYNYTAGGESMRIDSSGAVAIGSVNPTRHGQTTKTLVYNGSSTTSEFALHVGRVGTGAENQICFTNGYGKVGSVTTSGTSTSYNTSSDYRLKENLVDLTGASARVNQLNPLRFNWITDDTNTAIDGFLAHEVATVVPEAITGTKDAMRDEEYEVTTAVYEDILIEAVLDAEGNELEAERTEQRLVTEAVMGTRSVPDYQGIDQSKIVPLLTAALREALTKIDDMETRLAALEDV